jgi:hypothetical protein
MAVQVYTSSSNELWGGQNIQYDGDPWVAGLPECGSLGTKFENACIKWYRLLSVINFLVSLSLLSQEDLSPRSMPQDYLA